MRLSNFRPDNARVVALSLMTMMPVPVMAQWTKVPKDALPRTPDGKGAPDDRLLCKPVTTFGAAIVGAMARRCTAPVRA